jgi:hypothetical protein
LNKAAFDYMRRRKLGGINIEVQHYFQAFGTEKRRSKLLLE